MRERKNFGKKGSESAQTPRQTRIGYIYVLRSISSIMSTKKRHRGVPNPFHTIGSGDCGDGEPGEIEVVGWGSGFMFFPLPPRLLMLGKAP